MVECSVIERKDVDFRQCLRNEFRLDNFGLRYAKPFCFVTSQWPQCPRWLYLLWRLAAVVFFITITVCSGAVDFGWFIYERDRIKWFIYLTDWTLIVSTINVILQLIAVLYWYKDDHESGKMGGGEMPAFLKIAWIFYNVSTNINLEVTAIYWPFDHTSDKYLHPINIFVHAGNSLYVIVDLFITAIPVRLLHFYQAVTYMISYTVFGVVYLAMDGRNAMDKPYIYPSLEWTKPLRASIGVLCAALFGPIFFWLLVYGLCWFRRAIFYRTYVKRISPRGSDVFDEANVALRSEDDSATSHPQQYPMSNPLKCCFASGDFTKVVLDNGESDKGLYANGSCANGDRAKGDFVGLNGICANGDRAKGDFVNGICTNGHCALRDLSKDSAKDDKPNEYCKREVISTNVINRDIDHVVTSV